MSFSCFKFRFFLITLGVRAIFLLLHTLIYRTSFFFSWTLFSFAIINFTIDFILDLERLVFFFCVSWIASAVFHFSLSYIRNEKFKDRFFLLLISFVLSIFALVFSANLFSLIIGWDGLGITSFLLVIFFQNKDSLNAGLVTVFTNRVGDVFFISGIALITSYFCWNAYIFSLRAFLEENFFLSILLVLGAFTKRAQIPFSRWLPAAIAAPTPVSSLVHSRTLVTAGVYVLFRFKNSLNDSVMLGLCLFFGSLTMCIAGLGGLFERDFKKIVALSTLSQLGLIISNLGLGAFIITFFHLITHAFFKALLFLATGRSIHRADDYQDLRKISIPWFSSPITSAIAIISNFSLIGLPFFSGFYSKDIILELSLRSSISFSLLILFFLGTLLTILYSLRFILLSRENSLKKTAFFSHSDYDSTVISSFDYLFCLAVIRGSFLNWFYLAWSPQFFLSCEIKNLTLSLIFFGLIASWLMPSHFFLRNTLFPQWTLGTIWNLSHLSKVIFKNQLFYFSFMCNKHTEIFFSHEILFFSPFALIQKNIFWSNLISFSSFFFSLCFFFLLFLLCLKIEIYQD